MGLGKADVGPWNSSLAFWPRAPGEVGDLSVGAAPTWGRIPGEEEAGTVLGGAPREQEVAVAWVTDDPEHPPSRGVPSRVWNSPTPSPWTGLGRTCSAHCVQGARQLSAGEAIEARSLAEEGEARVRTRRPALARPIPSAQAQP